MRGGSLGCHIPLVAAALGDFSGSVGAAAAVLQSVYQDMGIAAATATESANRLLAAATAIRGGPER